eukprot:scaffold236117_cov28-Tisochrysis_lutea.AAC.2
MEGRPRERRVGVGRHFANDEELTIDRCCGDRRGLRRRLRHRTARRLEGEPGHRVRRLYKGRHERADIGRALDWSAL